MKKISFKILRIGLGITFVWIGVLIFMDPIGWGSYIEPWAAQLMPLSIETMMIITSILDIVIGLALVLGIFVWLAAFIGALHILTVLVTSGVTSITVRDIGLFAATSALALERWPGRR